MTNVDVYRLLDEWVKSGDSLHSSQVLAFAFALLREAGVELEEASDEEVDTYKREIASK